MANLQAELEVALAAMEASFHVKLISTFKPDLICAQVDDEATAWLSSRAQDFDQFPVEQGTRIVGILLRQDIVAGKTVGEIMRPLAEGLIVSADMPLADLIPQLRENHCRLVLRGGRIDGLVTQSDLLKLPVRLMVFAHITHLEQLMANAIAARWPNDAWFDLINEERREKINDKENELRNRGMNPPKIELTEFGDKRDLCKQIIEGSKKQFKTELNALRDLRDQLAHASTFIDGTNQKTSLHAFIEKFESAKRWINTFQQI
ncbi:MAG TPA: CBS domain-containing protein [Blastocatellia bacterium]|nr:CBS domain-containing protein [Blastocatellia bacterium]